jgi:spermidine synthase
MPTNSDSPDDRLKTKIQQGRAVVRLIEAIDVLLLDVAEPEASELRVLQQRYRQRLRAWVAELPPAISAQILIASEQIHGPAGEVTLN